MTAATTVWLVPADDGIEVTVERSGGSPSSRVLPATRDDLRSALEEVLGCGQPTLVIDRSDASTTVRDLALRFLLPALAPHGTYVYERAGTPGQEMPPTIQALLSAGEVDCDAVDSLTNHLVQNGSVVKAGPDTIEVQSGAGRVHLLEALPLKQLATAWSEDAPSATYQRIAPVVLDADMRASMASASFDFAPAVARPVESATLADVTVIGEGQIIVRSRYIVEETMSTFPKTNPWASLLRIEDSRYHVTGLDLDAAEMETVSAVVVMQALDRNYGHWLIDTVPRVRWAKTRLGGRRAPYLVNPPSSEAFRRAVNSPASEAFRRVMLESLAAFGVAAEDVLFSGPDPKRFESVVYVSP